MESLETKGDQFEKDYWPHFIKDQFPSYEIFWSKYILPTREQGYSSQPVAGEIPLDIYLAQLGYGVIRNLIRCFQVLQSLPSKRDFVQYDLFIEYLTRLTAALDNAEEILQRLRQPNKYQSQVSTELWKEAKKSQKGLARIFRQLSTPIY